MQSSVIIFCWLYKAFHGSRARHTKSDNLPQVVSFKSSKLGVQCYISYDWLDSPESSKGFGNRVALWVIQVADFDTEAVSEI